LSQKTEKEIIFNDIYEWVNSTLTINPHWIMLEIGSGPDGFAPFYSEYVKHFIGLDVDDYTNSYKNIPNVHILLYDGVTFPVPDKSIDIIVTHSVFEHVSDIERMLSETNRVLRNNGYFFLTINPLYYSSWGNHGTKDGSKLPPWEHLNPDSEYFLTDCPPQMINSGKKGCYLNKLTVSKLLSLCGSWPWSIIRFERGYESKNLPEFIKLSDYSIVDLRCHDIRLLIRKDW